jgi:hypothetical protein
MHVHTIPPDEALAETATLSDLIELRPAAGRLPSR